MTNDELRKLAEAAVGHQHRECLAKTKFRKAATPERILALLDENERLRAMYVGEPHQDDCLAYLEADYGVDYECSCGRNARLKDGDA